MLEIYNLKIHKLAFKGNSYASHTESLDNILTFECNTIIRQLMLLLKTKV